MINKYIYEFVGVAICKFIGTRMYFLKGGSGSMQALFTDACVLYISATEFPHKAARVTLLESWLYASLHAAI